MKYYVVSCLLALVLTSCGKKPQSVKVELTAEQKAKRQKLLRNIIDVTKIKVMTDFTPDGFVGRSPEEFAELIELADTVWETDEFTQYSFSMEGVSKNHEGWGTLVVRVSDGEIKVATVYYPEY